MSRAQPPRSPRAWAPRFWAFHVLGLVCVVAATGLGFWQLDAWSQRRAAESADLTRLEPVPLSEVIGPDDPFPGDRVGHPVLLRGTWLTDETVFVSGREKDGRDGFWVVTPLEVGPGDSALLVVRGWSASADDVPPAPEGETELVANLQPGEGTGAVDDDASDDVIPQMRIADVLQRVDQDLYGAYAVAAAAEPGLEQADLDQLPEAGRFTALRSLLYAVEWWVFGLFAAFVWWRWVRDELESENEPASGPEPADT